METQPACFEELYAQFGDRLFRFCYRLTGNRAEAEDLVQETFVAAFRGRDRYRGEAQVTTWLFRIALYQAKALRKRVALAKRFRIPWPPVEEKPFETMWLDQAIDGLPLKMREAFLLVKVEGLTHQEASEVLGVPVGTVKFRVFEAMKRLRSALGSPEGVLHGEEVNHAL